MAIKIYHRYTGAVLFDAPDAKTMREAILAAVKARADLTGAVLRSANGEKLCPRQRLQGVGLTL